VHQAQVCAGVRDDADRRVVGFGADLPAFLARPAPTAPISREE